MATHSSGSRVSPWAHGFTVFAGVMMLITGVFHAISGTVALFDDKFYVSTTSYTFEFDTTTWGWILLLQGVVLAVVGLGVLGGATWARIVGIAVVGIAMLENFLFLPYYPWWSIAIIAVDVAIVWALCHDTAELSGRG